MHLWLLQRDARTRLGFYGFLLITDSALGLGRTRSPVFVMPAEISQLKLRSIFEKGDMSAHSQYGFFFSKDETESIWDRIFI